jgi:N-succinyldiaminopimelate aminotransferase
MRNTGGTTIFEVVSRLAREHGALNLGQGFPDEGAPDDVIDAAARALREGHNQYPPMLGLDSLRAAAAAHDLTFYGIDVDWHASVLITAGASEGLAAALLGLVEPGDDVIVFAPAYDLYLPNILRAGGVPRVVRLQGPAWEVPWEELEAAFSPKTRLLVLNSPMNPTGKVWRREELERLAVLLRKHDCLALCDEVYEHLVFDGREHVPLMTLPGMFERCVRFASAGKTFSLTGWKVGYVVAPPPLLQTIARVHQFLVFTVPPNLQEGVAFGLQKPAATFAAARAALERKRDLFVAAAAEGGIALEPAAGTYFINLDIHQLGFVGPDTLCGEALIERAGVAAIPLSAFDPDGTPSAYLRLCFAKRDEVLREAAARLAQFRG